MAITRPPAMALAIGGADAVDPGWQADQRKRHLGAGLLGDRDIGDGADRQDHRKDDDQDTAARERVHSVCRVRDAALSMPEASAGRDVTCSRARTTPCPIVMVRAVSGRPLTRTDRDAPRSDTKRRRCGLSVVSDLSVISAGPICRKARYTDGRSDVQSPICGPWRARDGRPGPHVRSCRACPKPSIILHSCARRVTLWPQGSRPLSAMDAGGPDTTHGRRSK